MMSKKVFFLLLFVIQPVHSITLDWKGFSRTEIYYEFSDEKAYYGNLHLVLKPEIQVFDGLSVFSRLDLYPFPPPSQINSFSEERQTGFVFFSHLDSSKEEEATSLFLKLSQIYITYETEFLSLRLGKAPYHFGLGVTYSAETSPFDHWISTFNQLAFHFEYSSFYLQPALFLSGQKSFLSVNQVGMKGDQWDVKALLHYNIETSQSFVEAFTVYEENSIDAKLSLSYFFQDEEEDSSSKLAIAFEGGVDLPIGLTSRAELKSGYISKDFFVHPNYDVALLLGNRKMSLNNQEVKTEGDSLSQLNIAKGRINDVAYISPRFSFYFLQNHLKLTPLVVLDYKLSSKKWEYELDLKLHYNLEENFSVLIQAGVLPSAEKTYYGFLTQAAVTF